MNSPTEHYSNLKTSLAKVRRLVEGVEPVGCKTDLQHLKLQGFILIVHSIFEEYLEKICSDSAKTAKRNFERNGAISPALVALIATSVVDKISDTARKKVSGELAQDMKVFAVESVSRYIQGISNNHGIKSANQKKLFLPLGTDVETVDIGLSQNLNAFGGKRGAIAHTFSVRREETLSNIDVSIQNIVRDLAQLDFEACKACSPLSLA